MSAFGDFMRGVKEILSRNMRLTAVMFLNDFLTPFPTPRRRREKCGIALLANERDYLCVDVTTARLFSFCVGGGGGLNGWSSGRFSQQQWAIIFLPSSAFDPKLLWILVGEDVKGGGEACGGDRASGRPSGGGF